MTFKFKSISLVLLTSLAMGVYAGKNERKAAPVAAQSSEEGRCRKNECCKEHGNDCNKCDRVQCDLECCDKQPCPENCIFERARLSARACLEFENVLTAAGLRRNLNDKPGCVCGFFRICFSENLTKAEWEITIRGLDVDEFANQGIVGLALHVGNTKTVATDANRIVFLGGLDSNGNGPGCDEIGSQTLCRSNNQEVCCRGTLVAADLDNSGASNAVNMDQVFDAYRAGLLFVNVNGSNECGAADDVDFGLSTGGILRGQVRNDQTTGNFNDTPVF